MRPIFDDVEIPVSEAPVSAVANAAFVLTNCCSSLGAIFLGSFLTTRRGGCGKSALQPTNAAHRIAAVKGIARNRIWRIMVVSFISFTRECNCYSLRYARNFRGIAGGGGVHALDKGTAMAAMNNGTMP